MATATTPGLPSWQQTLDDFRGLRGSPRELWIVFAVKFLESIAFFAIYNLISTYLRDDLRLGDEAAGSIAGIWLTAISVMTFFSGFVADSLSLRSALLVSVTSCLVGRVILTFSTTRPLAYTALAIMSWGVASMLPTMTAAVRRYTGKRSVSFGFSLFYVMMNLGAFVAPRTMSWFKRHFREGATLDLPGLGATHFTEHRLVFGVGLIATLLAFAFVASMRPDRKVPPAKDAEPDPPAAASPWAALMEVVPEPAFRRFMLFVSLLVLVKLIFQHAHLTWPVYTQREFGRDFDFAALWSINPLMIIFLTPVVTALTQRRSAFACIVIGSVVSALSVGFMAVSTSYWACLAFVVTLSIGEALWSPRLYEYTAVIAPPGRSASYLGLSQLPMFLAKPLVGWMSGVMLATWCPATGPRNSHLLWVVVGLTTLVGPVAIVLLRGVIQGSTRAPEPLAPAPAR